MTSSLPPADVIMKSMKLQKAPPPPPDRRLIGLRISKKNDNIHITSSSSGRKIL